MSRIVIVDQNVSGAAIKDALRNYDLGLVSVMHSPDSSAVESAAKYSGLLPKNQLSHLHSDFLLSSQKNPDGLEKVLNLVTQGPAGGSVIAITDKAYIKALANHYKLHYKPCTTMIVIHETKRIARSVK